jgi:glycosyltransferase involved in cell wall biosynthesis
VHCCEHFFKINNGVHKIYDAIYIAAAKPYKRLLLASKIRSLFIVTYFWPNVKNDKGEWELHKFEPKISHAGFNKFRINENEVSLLINESKCGLALSKKEGAMWAVMEYLMSGVPVVSTKSKGGRDFFFSKNNSLIVKDTEENVSTGVQDMINRELKPEDIRNEVLNLIEPFRNKFIDLIFELSSIENNNVLKTDLYHKLWGNSNGISNNRII